MQQHVNEKQEAIMGEKVSSPTDTSHPDNTAECGGHGAARRGPRRLSVR